MELSRVWRMKGRRDYGAAWGEGGQGQGTEVPWVEGWLSRPAAVGAEQWKERGDLGGRATWDTGLQSL